MENFKTYIAKQCVGKKLYFECNCIFPLHHVGTIKDYEIGPNNEIIFLVDVDGKIIRLGENHPNLKVEIR